jgi:hypothetical protein
MNWDAIGAIGEVTGVVVVVVWVLPGALAEGTRRSVELFASEVMPQLK